MTIYSQRDGKWKNRLLGNSQTTIGSFGCLVTCISMVVGEPPDQVNEKLKVAQAFSGNLVVWANVPKAYPQLRFVERARAYDNDKVKSAIERNGFCLVEVDFDGKIATPNDTHWVVYTGNQRCLDPWTGVEKATSYYPLTIGYAVFDASVSTPQDSLQWFKGLLHENGIDPENAEGRIREIFDQSKKYETAQKERDKALRDLAEARGEAARFEELNITANREIKRLRDELDDVRRVLADREKEIDALEARVAALEAQTPPSGTVVISVDEYRSLKAKAVSALKVWDLIVALVKRLFGKR